MSKHRLENTVAVLTLTLAYGIAAAGAWYWLAGPSAPSRIVYQHPLFVSIPVVSRAQAQQWEITEGAPGQTVYRYQEYCLDRESLGIVRRQWIDGVVWPVPEKRNIGRVGCYSRSVAERLPHVAGEHDVIFQMRIDYPDENPLRMVSVDYADMPIRIVP